MCLRYELSAHSTRSHLISESTGSCGLAGSEDSFYGDETTACLVQDHVRGELFARAWIPVKRSELITLDVGHVAITAAEL